MFSGLFGGLFGKPSQFQQINTLAPWQQQLLQSLGTQGAQGLSQAQRYYQNLLDPSAQAYQDFAGPALRQFNQEIVPGIAGRFAGGNAMRSSAFNDAIGRAARDLGTNLSAQRAGLQMGAAQGLQGIGGMGQQAAMTPGFQNIFRPQTPGILDTYAPLLGALGLNYFGGSNFANILGGAGGLAGASGSAQIQPNQYAGISYGGVPQA